MSYVVRRHRYRPTPYVVLAVGVFMLWSSVARSESTLITVLGVISGSGLTYLGLDLSWSALRREIAVAVQPDAIILRGARRPRRFPWEQVAGVQVYVDLGGLDSTGSTDVVQVRLVDGAVKEVKTDNAHFDSSEFFAAVREHAPPRVSDGLARRYSGDDRWPTESSDLPGSIERWIDGLRRHR